MTLDPARLRALAIAAHASGAPWVAVEWCGTDEGGWAAIGPHHKATDEEDYDDAPDSSCHERAMADSAFIAAASPAAVIELLDALNIAEQRYEGERALTHAMNLDIGTLTEQRAAAIARAEASERRVAEMEAELEKQIVNPMDRKRKCPACGRMTRITTAGCDHCDLEDK